MGGIRIPLHKIQHPYSRSPRKGHRRNEIAQKTIQEIFQELKDKLLNGLSTKSGIKMALNSNKNKWKLEEIIAKLSKF